jgi:eukaryotic-like serine/threonine-protein kinase
MKTGTLMAVPFDLGSLQVTGDAVSLVENVMQSVNAANSADETGAGQFDVSASGLLVYASGGITPNLESEWLLVDAKGGVRGKTAAPPGPYLFPRLSPDGRRIAANLRRANTRAADVWIYDVSRGAPIRLTFDGTGSAPVWSPDGKSIAYARADGGVGNLYVTSADGSGQPQRLASSEFAQTPSSWAAATNTIAFLQRPRRETSGIWVVAMNDRDRTPRLFLESTFTLSHPEFSPDGRWLAYVSTESGGPEVYVQPYPGPGEKVRVSTHFGSEPLWAPNGRALLYRSSTQESQQVLSVALRSLSPFSAEAPQLLFEAAAGSYDSTSPIRSWDLMPDGQSFLLARFAASESAVTALHVATNWTDELRRLVPSR